MKALKKLPADFPEHSVDGVSHFDCNASYEEVQKKAYNVLALKFRTEIKLGRQTKCVMADLRMHNLFEDSMMIVVYSASENMGDIELKKKIKEIIQRIEKTSIEALTSCVYKQAIRKLSEATIGNRSVDTGDTKMMDYCGRKRIVDLSLIDTNFYNVKLNPDNLDVEGVDCDAVLKAKIRIFVTLLFGLLQDEPDFDKAVFDCFITKFKENKYFNRFMVLATMAELDLTKEQKEAEVQKTADFMAELTDKVAKCKSPA